MTIGSNSLAWPSFLIQILDEIRQAPATAPQVASVLDRESWNVMTAPQF
jgi:hypothetical protein